MHFHMPIQQVVRRKDTHFQHGFARKVKALLPASENFLLEPSRAGLLVLGKNEEALALPVETLRDIYGAKLEVQPPAVRLIEGVQVHEPIMHVRISMRVQFRDPVKAALQARGALAEEDYARANYCVLRYQAPLARLLGLAAELNACTAGSARHWIALSHYALVTHDPAGRAA